MVSRRWMWGLAVAAAGLWIARTARAENEVELRQDAAAGKPPAAARPAAASEPRRAVFAGYAAESARTATRLPPEERAARDFLRAASQQARFETDAAKLASQRAQGDRVKAFAAELLDFHTASDAELLHLLHARGMAPPMLENTQRKALNRLGRLQGTRFDREFSDVLGRERQRGDIEQYEKAVADIADPALRAWIDRQLPGLRQQQATAAQLVPAAAHREDLRRRPVAAAAHARHTHAR
ncbi:DUF4142 domain-containing protein [Ramlibacter humi]|uniref:DUF4142 domain-containing protein n=1 Tax=Ramlibacter humi TaxID=2530451 RepID=A0A4Z0C844_9BURK|nr:DUF4142 domain-containing protein [Ramlibacter humi]TFZ07783.1 DUF4142 domain-containing protein [Ramlibacter humi]